MEKHKKYGHEVENSDDYSKNKVENLVEEDRHGEGKGENKERYEKRDNDDFKEKSAKYAEKVEYKEKHSRKF